MQLYTMALSRLVPLLILVSVFLIAGRLVHDRARPSHPALAKPLFGAILLCGVLVVAPLVARAYVLLGAERAFQTGDWALSATRFETYSELRGSARGNVGYRWALALMNSHRYAEAESVLIRSFPPPGERRVALQPDRVLALASCRYYAGRRELAKKTLLALPPGISAVRDYLLGRIAEGEGLSDTSVASYLDALRIEPSFYPALYQLVRVLALEGRHGEAEAAVATFRLKARTRSGTTEIEDLSRAARGDSPPPELKEFLLVQVE